MNLSNMVSSATSHSLLNSTVNLTECNVTGATKDRGQWQALTTASSNNHQGPAGKGLDDYRISGHEPAMVPQISMAMEDLQDMIKQSSVGSNLVLRELPRDGNCFFHGLADVINHNRVALNRFIDCFNRLVEKSLLEQGMPGYQQDPSPHIDASGLRHLLHAWIQWAYNSAPDHRDALQNLTSEIPLQQLLENGYIRKMAPSSTMKEYYGSFGLLAVFTLATGVAVDLIQPRKTSGKDQTMVIVSERYCASGVLEHECGARALLHELRAKDPLLVYRQPGNNQPENPDPAVCLVFSGGEHYYPALPEASESASQDNAGESPQTTEESVLSVLSPLVMQGGKGSKKDEPLLSIGNNCETGAAVRLDSVNNNEVGSGTGGPSDNKESVSALLSPGLSTPDVDFSVNASIHEDDKCHELYQIISEELQGYEDSEAIHKYQTELAGAIQSLKAFKPLKTFRDFSNSSDSQEKSSGSGSVSINKRRSGVLMKVRNDESQMNACLQKLSENLVLAMESLQQYCQRINTISKKNEGGFGYKKLKILYEQLIDLLDRVFYIIGSMKAVVFDYRNCHGLNDMTACDKHFFLSEKSFAGAFYKLVDLMFVIAQMRSLEITEIKTGVIGMPFKIDSRLLRLNKKLIEELMLYKRNKALDFEGENKDNLQGYLLSICALLDPGKYYFANYHDRQESCDIMMSLLLFVAKVKQGHQLRESTFAAECALNTPFLNVLLWHFETIKHIKALKQNLEAALLIAGGTLLSMDEREIVFGTVKKKVQKSKGQKKTRGDYQKGGGRHRMGRDTGKSREITAAPLEYDDRFIKYIRSIIDHFFTVPLDPEDGDEERIGYLKEVASLLSINQGYFPELAGILTSFNKKIENCRKEMKTAVIAQRAEANKQLEEIKKRKAESGKIKKHQRMSRTKGSWRTIAVSSSGDKINMPRREKDKQGSNINSDIKDDITDKALSDHQAGAASQAAQCSNPKPKPEGGNRNILAILDKTESWIAQATATFAKNGVDVKVNRSSGREREEAKQLYLRAIKELDHTIKKKDVAVAYDNTLLLVTQSSRRIEYEDCYHGFFNSMYAVFHEAELWRRTFEKAAQNYTLPRYPKHQQLVELVEKLEKVGIALTDTESSNIAKAIGEQHRAMEILKAHSLTARGIAGELPYFDDQMNYLKKNKVFMDNITEEFAVANKNALQAIAHRRFILKKCVLPGYYRNKHWKGPAPKYQPVELVKLLQKNIDNQQTFAVNINRVEYPAL